MLSTVDMTALATRLATLDEVKGRSLWADARIRFSRNRAAVAGLIMLIFCFAFAFIGQHLSPYTFDFTDFTAVMRSTSLANGGGLRPFRPHPRHGGTRHRLPNRRLVEETPGAGGHRASP